MLPGNRTFCFPYFHYFFETFSSLPLVLPSRLPLPSFIGPPPFRDNIQQVQSKPILQGSVAIVLHLGTYEANN